MCNCGTVIGTCVGICECDKNGNINYRTTYKGKEVEFEKLDRDAYYFAIYSEELLLRSGLCLTLKEAVQDARVMINDMVRRSEARTFSELIEKYLKGEE